ncbi:MAG: hypothetical protein KGL39_34865 [Patescibacteria group bacterium]|nr:hypothetical protein [Patescibacteria group bacterium]
MAIQEVSGQVTGTQRTTSSLPLTLTYPSPTTSGNLLICVVTQGSNSTISVSDNKGNTWQKAVDAGTPALLCEIWYCPHCSGGSGHQVTITPTAGGQVSAVIDEFSAVAKSPLDNTNNSAANGSSASTGVVTLAPGELAIVALSVSAQTTIVPNPGMITYPYTQAATSAPLNGISYGFAVSAGGGAAGGGWGLGTGHAAYPWLGAIASFAAASIVDDETGQDSQLQQDYW